MKDKILNLVYNFFIKSSDFNGIPLRSISKEMEIEYEKSIDLINELVNEGSITIQSSTNPHIIGFGNFSIENQIQILEQAKDTKVKIQKIGEVEIRFEGTKFPICLYPSSDYLKINRDLAGFNNAFYTQQLALGEGIVEKQWKGTQQIVEEWLRGEYDFKDQEIAGKLFKALKKIKRERQTPAHRINENGYDSKYIERQKEVMKEAYSVFRNLLFVFQ